MLIASDRSAMSLRVFILALLACCGAIVCRDMRFGTPALVKHINSQQNEWKAGFNLRFKDVGMDVIKGMMGVIDNPELAATAEVLDHANLDVEVADSFDSRTNWPECSEVIGEIRDQSACGSCWAMGAVEAMSDRICISSGGKSKPHISANDLMSCCGSCGFGCNGGFPLAAWQYFQNPGLVTGGNYTTKSGCQPYPFPPCEHHTTGPHYKPCPAAIYPTPECTRECQATYPIAYGKDKHKGDKSYMVSRSVSAIQKEIQTNGPVEAAFTVYEDFLTYKSGVYHHVTGSMLGGHAVKMLGWGVENGVDYWLMANSWNTDWGDKGFFKIRRGHNECGIEGGITAGHPELN